MTPEQKSDQSKQSTEFDGELDGMRQAVNAAEDEAMLAVQFHESWRPAAFDEELHARMGQSYATHTFQIVRSALRREMLMALMRIWDKDSRTVRLAAIVEKLRNKAFFEGLVRNRAQRMGFNFDCTDAMRDALKPKRDQVVKLVHRYAKDGESAEVFERVSTLRHQWLAHRQIDREPISASVGGDSEREIEQFYQDTLEIIRLLLSIVLARAFDIANDGAGVYSHHASFFWASVRGERTEGHPNFRAPDLE
ncbi:hypothetical protein [Burkholderia sp. 567]|uniref:AbiU2 domain-containing protein n=1 Tax=Burkholderia sp. 567 TaxID=3156413 RepID=UPI003391586E